MTREKKTSQPLRQWKNDLETEAIRSHHWESVENRPQAEAISLASVWQMASPETADAALDGQPGVFVYRRDGHPNDRTLTQKLARLHNGEHACLTAQGMSAIGAVALGMLDPGKQVWVAEELYGKSIHLFDKNLRRWGVDCQLFDPTHASDIEALQSAGPDLVLIETMSNPRLNVPDIPSVAAATHAGGGLLVVDNTFATHLICQPLLWEADIVVESLGKQVNGHSDAMVGLIVCDKASHLQPIQDAVSTFGMASSPMDCYLTHRGLSTLALRVDRACDNAMALAQELAKISQVQSVDYPGLGSHPQHKLACDQFRGGFGWMVTIRLDLDDDGVVSLFERLSPETPFVPSLGDVSTTLSHPASTSHRGFTEDQRLALGISHGTIRISCGIEPTEWLVEHFAGALKDI